MNCLVQRVLILVELACQVWIKRHQVLSPRGGKPLYNCIKIIPPPWSPPVISLWGWHVPHTSGLTFCSRVGGLWQRWEQFAQCTLGSLLIVCFLQNALPRRGSCATCCGVALPTKLWTNNRFVSELSWYCWDNGFNVSLQCSCGWGECSMICDWTHPPLTPLNLPLSVCSTLR